MIFQGETYEECHARQFLLLKPQPWKRVFAWFPVCVGDNRTAWLQFVYKRKLYHYSNGMVLEYSGSPEYREAIPTSDRAVVDGEAET